MKLKMTFYILLSTSLLILVALMAFYQLPFSWVFFATLIGQASLLLMVYKILSFLYNLVGLYFAVTGELSPVIAAILMPLSSISIIAFTTICTNIIGRKL